MDWGYILRRYPFNCLLYFFDHGCGGDDDGGKDKGLRREQLEPVSAK
jgi:hypothetical protein